MTIRKSIKKVDERGTLSFPFLELPPELRNRVHDFALSFPKSSVRITRKDAHESQSDFRECITIMQICKSIREEVRPIVINSFFVSINIEEATAFADTFYTTDLSDEKGMRHVKGRVRIRIAPYNVQTLPQVSDVLPLLRILFTAPFINYEFHGMNGSKCISFFKNNTNFWRAAIETGVCEIRIMHGYRWPGAIALVSKKDATESFLDKLRNLPDQVALYRAKTTWGSELRDVEVLEYRRNA